MYFPPIPVIVTLDSDGNPIAATSYLNRDNQRLQFFLGSALLSWDIDAGGIVMDLSQGENWAPWPGKQANYEPVTNTYFADAADPQSDGDSAQYAYDINVLVGTDRRSKVRRSDPDIDNQPKP